MGDIPTRVLGRTGLEVTVLGYGAMELRDLPKGRHVDDADADKLLNAVLDSGINFVDTSIDYGLAEERIGRAISHRRSEYYLASKCGCPFDADPATAGGGDPHIFTRENIRAGVEQSLRRLQTDYLDLLQVHMSPPVAQLQEEGAIEVLTELRDEGKIRFLGMSGTLPHLPDQLALGVFDVFQIPYSVLEPEHEQWITRVAQAGAGVIVRGGVGKGAPGKRTGTRGDKLVPLWDQADLDGVREDLSSMEFILRHTLTHPDVSTIIAGTASLEHLQDNVRAASRGPLSAGAYEEALLRVRGIVGY